MQKHLAPHFILLLAIPLAPLLLLLLSSCEQAPEWIQDIPLHSQSQSSSSSSFYASSSPFLSQSTNPTASSDPLDTSSDIAPITPTSLGLDKPTAKAFQRPPDYSSSVFPPPQSSSSLPQSPSATPALPTLSITIPQPEFTFLNDPPLTPSSQTFSSNSASHLATSVASSASNSSSATHSQSSSQLSHSITNIFASAQAALSSLVQRQNSIAFNQSTSETLHQSSSLQSSSQQFASSSASHHTSSTANSSSALTSCSNHFNQSSSSFQSSAPPAPSSPAQLLPPAAPQLPPPSLPSTPPRSPDTLLILIPSSIQHAPPPLQEVTTAPIPIQYLSYWTDAEALAYLSSVPIALAILPDSLLALPKLRAQLQPILPTMSSLLNTIAPLFKAHYFDVDNKFSLPLFHTSIAIAHRKDALSRPVESWQDVITLLQNSTPPPSPTDFPTSSPQGKTSAIAPIPPLLVSLPTELSLHPSLWAKMLNLPQRRAPAPPPWWPTAETNLVPRSQANLIIDLSHILLSSVDFATWHIALPKEGTLTRLYSITIPKNNPHSEETLVAIIQSLLSPAYQKQLPTTLHLASPLFNALENTPTHPFLHIIYPPNEILDQSQFALPFPWKSPNPDH